ncbi:DUF1127 domain-containing protein [Rhizobium sp. LCM 4573]|uniref:DUF1127 domain-containing protein n=1 Tax=Rhizobium sp. LCM 4573 TaxID=1848291 RepID=UPI0008DA51C7|nr:DUF1127 domain-containing protein [Rhizobium sp. LCM 4573]OHV81141.1 hypothetical protein LCM4573_22480 [Rhizobium sp. LCM 4573]
MRRLNEYLATIDTIYPDSFVRESQLRASGDLLAPSPLPAPRKGVLGLIDIYRNWNIRRKGRLALLDMEEAQLRDIGLTRVEARREAAKSRFLF